MPRCNRVTPFGAIEADPARGLLMGNRGILHDAQGRLGTARWRTAAWICCRLEFKGRRRSVMTPGSWTELFFLDEAVALAAGHRPCAECRRDDFRRFAAAWGTADGSPPPRAPAIDAALHAARVARPGRRQRTFRSALAGLPDGSFVTLADDPGGAWLVRGGALHRWAHAGYGPTLTRPPTAEVEVLTPELTVAALAAGYAPLLHRSAG